jgi:hypothetical protein
MKQQLAAVEERRKWQDIKQVKNTSLQQRI